MEWGIVSYIIRYYFNPCGTGSHLYSANTNTLRSVHWVKVLLALVGTHTRGRLALPFCILIISQTLRFVKTFFNFFWLKVGLEPTSRPILFTDSTINISPQMGELESNEWDQPWDALPHLLNTICVLYPYCITTQAICQGVFSLFSNGWT